jgi:hypothetical protein
VAFKAHLDLFSSWVILTMILRSGIWIYVKVKIMDVMGEIPRFFGHFL